MSRPIRIATLDNGGVVEAVEDGLQLVYDNIVDPNTKAAAVRELHLVMKFKPNKERNFTDLEYSVKHKLQNPEPVNIPVFVDLDHRNRKAVGVELDFPTEDPAQHVLPNVTQLKKENAGE